jgi:TolA-binding protein
MQLESALKLTKTDDVSIKRAINSDTAKSDVSEQIKKVSLQMRKLSRDVRAIKKSLGINTKKNNKLKEKVVQDQSIFGDDTINLEPKLQNSLTKETNLQIAELNSQSEKNVAEEQFKVIELMYQKAQDTKLSNTERVQKRRELADAIRYFIQTYGKEPQAKKAMYWLGCTYLDDARATTDKEIKKSIYHNAKVTLVKAYQSDRSSKNTPECLLKIGEAMYYEDRETSANDACTIWAKLKADFPNRLKNDEPLRKQLDGFVKQVRCK